MSVITHALSYFTRALSYFVHALSYFIAPALSTFLRAYLTTTHPNLGETIISQLVSICIVATSLFFAIIHKWYSGEFASVLIYQFLGLLYGIFLFINSTINLAVIPFYGLFLAVAIIFLVAEKTLLGFATGCARREKRQESNLGYFGVLDRCINVVGDALKLLLLACIQGPQQPTTPAPDEVSPPPPYQPYDTKPHNSRTSMV